MELIITEKPSSAEKIAKALADDKPKKLEKNGVKYWELEHNGHPITVCSAVGHLFTVTEKDKKGWTYPVFDTQWIPSADASKAAAFTKKYLTLIKSLAKKAKDITVATDFDIEGEVIGYTILKYACKRDDGNRMKYSTVMAEELLESYNNKSPTIAWGQANAGVTRHELDWYYGINLSRALTLAVKSTGRFKILSSGRVQTPALKLLADKEAEIQAFVAVPYWQVELHTDKLVAMHVEDKFWEKKQAETAKKNVTKTAVVDDVTANQTTQAPPNPFDLTTLQTEAYRSFGMKPKETASHAQELYSNGYISYPRTSSQQLPKEIGYEKVLKKLSKLAHYTELANKLLQVKNLTPNNGKKKDAAHPAIYPTGEPPKKAKDRTLRVYDLVVRRFMATFGEPAIRETQTIILDSGNEKFSTKATRTLVPGWHVYYGPHVKLKDEELPAFKKDDSMPVIKVELQDKETQPPRRYTPSSIVRELEKRNLGTKATRADIVESLYARNYITDDSIKVTRLGMQTVSTLSKYVPEVMDEGLTATIEQELEDIREDKTTGKQVLDDAKKHLTKLLANFKKHESAIGEELKDAQQETWDNQTKLGKCPACKDGELQIKRGKWGGFVGCTGYPECEQTYALPSGATFAPAQTQCVCGTPMLVMKRGKGRARAICFNLSCENKALTPESQKLADQAEAGDMKCEKCGEPIVVRRSALGTFLGCSGFPKCRNLKALESKLDAQKAEEKAAKKEE